MKQVKHFRKLLWALPLLLSPFASVSAAEFCADDFYVDTTLANGARWDMCWEHRNREGIVLHHIFYTPSNGERRMVMYQASIAQIHVPYDDNGARYHDVSDYGLGGGYMHDLTASECPGGVLLNGTGTKNLICQQVQDQGFSYYRDFDSNQGEALSLLSTSGIGAYNYIPRWVFHDNGMIEPSMGATGSLQRFGDASKSAHGWFVTDTQIGISHLHNFFWKLDFDLNQTSDDDYVEEMNFNSSAGGRSRSMTRFYQEAKRSVDPSTLRSWRVVDGSSNDNGHPISYEIVLADSGHKDIGPSGEPFTFNDFYVTRKKTCELFASHNPTNTGCESDLDKFVNSESVNGEDLVVWAALTFYHVPRAEDKPIMDAHWSRFQIIPRDWHESNPTALLPPGC